eukprot:scaffold195921_cov16-Tisochrysis_lutea.AAC.1
MASKQCCSMLICNANIVVLLEKLLSLSSILCLRYRKKSASHDKRRMELRQKKAFLDKNKNVVNFTKLHQKAAGLALCACLSAPYACVCFFKYLMAGAPAIRGNNHQVFKDL